MRINRQKKRIIRGFVTSILAIIALVVTIGFLRTRNYHVLDAQGLIAAQQRDLLYFATALSLIVILPVFVLTWHIVRTYRVDSKRPAKKRPYQPEWDHNHKLEALWWAIPSVIILALSVVTWTTSHSLDPYKPLEISATASANTTGPLDIQVVALEWNWLFLYPEQGIATLNHLVVPAGTPLNFKITADAPMNSFWIPQLGGQVYAMSGMSSKLHLIADQPGTFRGSSANLSGEGYADMNFQTKALNLSDFNDWVRSATNGKPQLTANTYEELRKPERGREAATYLLPDTTLYQSVIDRYMAHGTTEESHAHDN